MDERKVATTERDFYGSSEMISSAKDKSHDRNSLEDERSESMSKEATPLSSRQDTQIDDSFSRQRARDFKESLRAMGDADTGEVSYTFPRTRPEKPHIGNYTETRCCGKVGFLAYRSMILLTNRIEQQANRIRADCLFHLLRGVYGNLPDYPARG